jgi:hypothetical protein
MQKSKNNKITILSKIYFLFWSIYFLIFWSKALYLDKFGNLVAGHVNIWGDWAAHFTMGTAMANRGLLLKTSPFLINAKFSYPFISDLISAVILRITENTVYSFIIPSFLLSIFFVWAIYYFFKTIWQSEKKAILSSLVFMLNGGLGFYYFFQEVATKNNPLTALLNPAHEVTRYDLWSIKWINIIDSMIIPQRAFLLGFPLTVLALTLIYKNFFQNNKVQFKQTLLAGVILGLMPIIHTHSFLAAFIILAFWSLEDILNHTKISLIKKQIDSWPSKKIKDWSNLLIITALISLPLLVKFFMGSIDQGFMKFFPGWLANTYKMNWIEFWWRNWFLVPWLSLMGFFVMAKRDIKKLLIFSPFIFIFIIANLFLFQPFAWDNTKLFVWASLGFSYLTIYTLSRILEKKNSYLAIPYKLKVIGVSLIFFFTILSGLLDIHYIIRHDLHHHIMYTKEELELTSWVKENTPYDSIWLTGDKHNHFIFNLTGRKTILTYRGWLWTHGYEYLPIEKEVKKIYKQPEDNLDLLEKYQVDYIIVGSNEKTVWGANENAFIENFTLIKQTNHYKIFESKYN